MVHPTASQRRKEVLDAAISKFAELGFHAATTAGIATESGISQSYVMHLFGSKKGLFLAAWDKASDRLEERIVTLDVSDDPIGTMAGAYERLISEQPDLMRLQLQGWTLSTQDEDIRSACSERFFSLWSVIGEKLGLDRSRTAPLMAAITYFNVVVSLQIQDAEGCSVAPILDGFRCSMAFLKASNDENPSES